MQYSSTILLIDDDADDHEFFAIALGRISNTYELLKAENGQQALDLLDQINRIPDYIFLDLNMPAVDGKQFLKLVKHHPRFSDLNIIMYTTSANEDDVKETLQLGAKQFITKPDTIEEIVNKISTIVNA